VKSEKQKRDLADASTALTSNPHAEKERAARSLANHESFYIL